MVTISGDPGVKYIERVWFFNLAKKLACNRKLTTIYFINSVSVTHSLVE